MLLMASGAICTARSFTSKPALASLHSFAQETEFNRSIRSWVKANPHIGLPTLPRSIKIVRTTPALIAEMPSSDSEGQTPLRKRSRQNSGNEPSNKKARGRPRVDTEDATAADRRRTQIRLAQRAYRQRKETTISSLKQQNASLQSIIEQMNKSFLRFNDSALKSGLLQLNPTLAQELKHVTETFVTLAKNAAAESGQDDDESGENGLDPATELHNAAAASRESHQRMMPEHTDVGWGYSAMLGDSPRLGSRGSPQNDILNHSTYFPAMKDSPYETARDSSLVRMRQRPLTVGQVLDQSRSQTLNSNNSDLPFGLMDIIMRDQNTYSSNYQINPVNIPTPDVTPPTTRLSTPPLLPSLTSKSLTTPWTYSHDETTFARRLTRAALETGFHLLSSANLRPAALNYVFKLSLPYMSLDALRERFKVLLARGTDEDLDSWDTPFIHLGGAGTHYPRKDASGNTIAIPNAWNVRSIGLPPVKLIRAENAEDPSKSHDLSIDLTGFEGEWFDAHDVQGYLEDEKGCHINPKDSFAEVLVEVDDSANARPDSIVYSKTLPLSLDLAEIRPSTNTQTASPGLSNASSSTDSLSAQSTPPTTTVQDPSFAQTDMPFGLDMNVSSYNDFGKFNETDLFEQPLGLDLAPGFGATGLNAGGMPDLDYAAFGDMSALGMDLMGTDVEVMPVVRQKQKKAALIDVSKLIDGKSCFLSDS
ncbi:hypothetical protein BDV96DRAFT_167888 [Lophiotrema nucula]|uniref:BZIP domain-containing protein n=1 Tax=Lophiotrema nucula TaxID=690887 RepID=A0A6A5YY60_9PLEO|nr:hypothetical protein BDV96DRAFT_167888 [Lophiotrema nucula]